LDDKQGDPKANRHQHIAEQDDRRRHVRPAEAAVECTDHQQRRTPEVYAGDDDLLPRVGFRGRAAVHTPTQDLRSPQSPADCSAPPLRARIRPERRVAAKAARSSLRRSSRARPSPVPPVSPRGRAPLHSWRRAGHAAPGAPRPAVRRAGSVDETLELQSCLRLDPLEAGERRSPPLARESGRRRRGGPRSSSVARYAQHHEGLRKPERGP
jgi:hypothetical protein